MSADILGREGGQRTQNIRFITRLCRDVMEFNRRHSSYLYNIDLETEMMQIFEMYATELLVPDNNYMPLIDNQGMDDLANRVASPRDYMQSLFIQLLASTRANAQERMRYGISPVISANMALARCDLLGLSEFLEDDTLWEE